MYDETLETHESYFKVTHIVAFHIVQCFSNARWHAIKGIAQIILERAKSVA